jgi:hypothetical protein
MGSKRGQQTATKELTIPWQGMAKVGGGQFSKGMMAVWGSDDDNT